MYRHPSEFPEIERRLRGLLVAGRHDFTVEVYDCAPIHVGKAVVLLTGSARDWHAQEREVVTKLRASEADWRPGGVLVEYRFMALDAMAA